MSDLDIKQYGQLPIAHKYAGQWRDVVDGDTHDIRIPEFDGNGNIVGLRFKFNGQHASDSHPNSKFYVRLSANKSLFRFNGELAS